MQSKNFEFLRPTWADLADIGAIAEQYAHPDPESAVARLRTYAEQIVLFMGVFAICWYQRSSSSVT